MRHKPSLARERNKRRARSRILIVTEGARTEVLYFQLLMQHFRAHGVTHRTAKVKPGSGGPTRVLETAIDEARSGGDSYDSVWLVLDVDQHDDLDRTLDGAADLDMRVVVSNPQFELWLLWHFEELTAHSSKSFLESRLAAHGHEGKSLRANFPVADYDEARRRARRTSPELNAVGSNPSSAVGLLIDSICSDGTS